MAEQQAKPLRIGIDAMLVRRGAAGVETAIYGLAEAAARFGRCEYRIFLTRHCGLPDVRGPQTSTIRCAVPGGLRLLRLLHQQLGLPRQLATAGCDLLHAAGYLCPRRPGRPVVLTVFDLIAWSHPHLCRRSTVLNYRLQLPGAVARACRLIVPSVHVRDDLARRFPAAAERIRVVPLAVDERFAAAPAAGEGEALRRAYGLPAQFILFVGQIEPKKNVPGLLRGYAELRRLAPSAPPLVVAGSRGWEPVDPGRLAAELGIAGQVVLPGFVAREDLPALYRAAELFVFPSLCEGFGLPPLEAMAAGTAVVVADRDSLPEVVGDAGLLADPCSPTALAGAMGELLANPERRVALAVAGRQRAAQFTWRRHVEATEAVYREAAAGQ